MNGIRREFIYDLSLQEIMESLVVVYWNQSSQQPDHEEGMGGNEQKSVTQKKTKSNMKRDESI